MATDVLKPSRRGFLGIFAAGAAAAAVAIPMEERAPALPRDDWRTKPVGQWSRGDYIAEAEFEVSGHRRKEREVFSVGMSHHEEQLFRAHQQMRAWWELELLERRGAFD